MLLADVIKRLDSKNKGKLTAQDFATELKIDLPAANRVVSALDQNSDNVVSTAELKEALDRTADSKVSVGEIASKLFAGDLERAWNWVHQITGSKPLVTATSLNVPIDQIINRLDTDGDSMVSRSDLVRYLSISQASAEKLVASFPKKSGHLLPVLGLREVLDPQNQGFVAIPTLAKYLFENRIGDATRWVGSVSPEEHSVQFDQVMKFLDPDGQDKLSPLALATKLGITRAAANKLFERIDKDKDGFISRKELQEFLKPVNGVLEIQQISKLLEPDLPSLRSRQIIRTIKAFGTQ